MKDQKLSEHFLLSEFTQSATATVRGIDNTPGKSQIERLRLLCQRVLEPLREHAGRPVRISSGYRSPALNRAVGGAEKSQHLKGEAADIAIPDEKTGNEWFEWLERNVVFDQLIKERKRKNSKSFWIHVSYKDCGNRKMVIRGLIKNAR